MVRTSSDSRVPGEEERLQGEIAARKEQMQIPRPLTLADIDIVPFDVLHSDARGLLPWARAPSQGFRHFAVISSEKRRNGKSRGSAATK
ncbi:hypothetical protein J2W46_006618 [Paraburkholderia strydomiana]|nr:hypothetical protein [Paraburkholderia strydomiana]